MALDRQSIEKKDFPIGRRGYDPDAVDAHLGQLAGEIDELKRSARRRSESLAAAASEQVRSIVEAAETSAAEIQRQAEDDAREIRSDATTDADATREHATAEARDYVGRVSESTAAMLERIEAMQTELNALIESLRTGSNRLSADLQLLEGNLSTVKNAVVPRPRFEPEHEPPAARGAAAAPEPAPAPGAAGGSGSADGAMDGEQFERSVGVVPTAGGEAIAGATAGTAAAEAPNGSDDLEGARLVALNMAMDGKSREETERYLAEHFRLTDRRQLLDDVYAAFGG